MNINKHNKNNKNNKNKLKSKTLRHQNIKQKGHNYTQKIVNQLGGTKTDVCEELPELKRFDIFNIFKYAIQLPKITK
jgi:hypothetical protein